MKAYAKDLEVYAGDTPPADYSLSTEVAGIARVADAAQRTRAADPDRRDYGRLRTHRAPALLARMPSIRTATRPDMAGVQWAQVSAVRSRVGSVGSTPDMLYWSANRPPRARDFAERLGHPADEHPDAEVTYIEISAMDVDYPPPDSGTDPVG